MVDFNHFIFYYILNIQIRLSLQRNVRLTLFKDHFPRSNELFILTPMSTLTDTFEILHLNAM